jgi:hypothetical protein
LTTQNGATPHGGPGWPWRRPFLPDKTLFIALFTESGLSAIVIIRADPSERSVRKKGNNLIRRFFFLRCRRRHHRERFTKNAS